MADVVVAPLREGIISRNVAQPPRSASLERHIERALRGSRWLLVPFHFGLLIAVGMLLAKFAQVVFVNFVVTFSLSGKEVIVASLSLIELALIASLLLMVVFSSYEGFVSRLNEDAEPSEPLAWAGRVGFGDLKLRIMASVTAISGVYLLERVIRADDAYVANIGWAAGAFALFVVASVVMAFVERFSARGSVGNNVHDK